MPLCVEFGLFLSLQQIFKQQKLIAKFGIYLVLSIFKKSQKYHLNYSVLHKCSTSLVTLGEGNLSESAVGMTIQCALVPADSAFCHSASVQRQRTNIIWQEMAREAQSWQNGRVEACISKPFYVGTNVMNIQFSSDVFHFMKLSVITTLK